jgi:hypothetical protein
MSWSTPRARAGLRCASVALVGALALAGCGEDEPRTAAPEQSQQPSPSSSPSLSPTQLVQEASAKTMAAGSANFALASSAAVGDNAVVLKAEGAYDFAAKSGVATFDVPTADGQGTAGRIEQRIIGDSMFLSLPAAPEVFYQLPVADVAGTALGASADPTAALQALVGAGVVEEVGEEEVRGVPTTRYQGTYDVRDALAVAQGPAKAILETALAGSQLVLVPFDAYLDSEGRLVKYQQRVELPAGPETGGQVVTSVLTLELFDFGAPVSVVPPPPEAVKPGGPLLDAIRETVPKVVPAPPPVEPAPPVEPPPAAPPAPVPPAPAG